MSSASPITPSCLLLPEPGIMADLQTDYASYYERDDLAAAVVAAIHLDCALGTYEPDSYVVGGHLLDLVIEIEDDWKE
jgi:hypothetical protein